MYLWYIMDYMEYGVWKAEFIDTLEWTCSYILYVE